MKPPARIRMTTAAAAAIVLVAAAGARAAVRFVDGACPTSGTGASLTCGAHGPFRTIGEGIVALQPGDTLNVRGAHGSFDGVYFESLALREGAAVPGKSLPCTSGQPCRIQGCRATTCGADEQPLVRGMTHRSDWVALGGGVFQRTMEASPNPDPLARDAFDPTILVDGSTTPFTVLGYAGDAIGSPDVGQWSYDPATRRIAVHPAGADPSPIFVPHFGFNADIETPTAYVTLQYLTFEGVRGYSIYLETITPDRPIAGMLLSHLVQRYAGRKFIQTTRGAVDSVIEDTVSEYGGRGISYATTTDDGFFGYRLFGFHNGIVRRNTIRHIGATGQVRISGGSAWPCPWCDPPWNDPQHTYISTSGIAYQLKQTDTATLEDNVAEDVSTGAISLDVSRHVTVHRNQVSRAATGIGLRNFTPTAGCPSTATSEFCYNSDHTIYANLLDEVGYADIAGCGITIIGGSDRAAGATMLAQVYNNVVSRIGFAGICVASEEATPTSDVSLWNNTIYGERSVPGASPSSGVVVMDGTQNVALRDNAFDALSAEGIAVRTTAPQGLSFDGDVLGTIAGCEVHWGDGTCDPLAQHDAHTRTGALLFADPTASPPDLHLTPGSVAIDAGVNDAVSVDMEDHPRPQGAGWDAGAYEFGPEGPTTSTTLPPFDRCLSGGTLLLAEQPRRLLLRSRDTAQLVVGTGADASDAIAQGGTLHVLAVGGDGFEHTYPLPAAKWHLLQRKHPNAGVVYRDRSGPISSIVFKAHRVLVARGSGPRLVQDLASDPAVLEVDLQLGPYGYHLQFAGPRGFKRNKRLRRRAVAPQACPNSDP